MKRPTISYANVVATLALFIALGGVSWAAVKLPKNSVGSKQIKKNAVTSAKIKKNSIISSKIKNGAIQGADINLGSLGKVPSAAVADTAENTFFVSKTGLVTGTDNDANVAQSLATEVPLYSIGQISFYAKCFKDADNDRVYGGIYARTTANGTYFNGYNSGGGAMDINSPESSRYLLSDYAASDTQDVEQDYDANLLIGTDGVGAQVSSIAGMRNGTPSGPIAVIFPGEESCVFTMRGFKVKV